jgi:hypothetical protein
MTRTGEDYISTGLSFIHLDQLGGRLVCETYVCTVQRKGTGLGGGAGVIIDNNEGGGGEGERVGGGGERV